MGEEILDVLKDVETTVEVIRLLRYGSFNRWYRFQVEYFAC